MEFEEYLSLKEDYLIYIDERNTAREESCEYIELSKQANSIGDFGKANKFLLESIKCREYARLREEQADKLLKKIVQFKLEFQLSLN